MKHGKNKEKRKSLYNLLSVLNQCFHPGDTAKSRHGDTEKGRHGEEPKSDLRVSVSPRLRVGLPGLRVCFACSLKLSHFSHFMPLLEKRKIVALWPRTGYAEYPMSWTEEQRQGDKENRYLLVHLLVSLSPCLLVSPSRCLV